MVAFIHAVAESLDFDKALGALLRAVSCATAKVAPFQHWLLSDIWPPALARALDAVSIKVGAMT